MKKKYILLSLLLLIPALVFGLTYEWVIDQMEYADDDAAQTAYVSSNGYDANENTKLLIHFNGSDGDQSDYTAETGQTVTTVGTAQLDTALKVFGTASLLLDGNSDYATVPDSDDWDFGTGDFTIECRGRFSGLSGAQYLFDIGAGNSGSKKGILLSKANITDDWSCLINDVAKFSISTDDPVINTWYHFAITRSSGTLYFFIDGVEKSGGVASTEDMTGSTEGVHIGARSTNLDFLDGWIDEFRILKGEARWTSNFTPPASEYGALQSYSESTIVQQGTYSLKGVAIQVDSLNDTLTKTLTGADKLDLTNAETIEYDIYALRTGSNIKLSIHDSGGTTTEHTANIASSNTNQTESWDISGVSDVNKDDIDWIKFTVVNADAANVVIIDDIKWGITAVSGGSWTFVN